MSMCENLKKNDSKKTLLICVIKVNLTVKGDLSKHMSG